MARISIVEAAKAGFRSRSQINKDVRSGKLPSFTEEMGDGKTRKVVDTVDLIALYGEPHAPVAPPSSSPPGAALEEELARAREDRDRIEGELSRARRQLEERERDRMLGVIEQQTKQIADMRDDQAAKPAGFWGWLTGKG
jgi:hypothetical protein